MSDNNNEKEMPWTWDDRIQGSTGLTRLKNSFFVGMYFEHVFPLKCFSFTWTLDSGRLILSATSSLMKTSGYRVRWNRLSKTSNCCRENVVRSRRCFFTKTIKQLFKCRFHFKGKWRQNDGNYVISFFVRESSLIIHFFP